MMLLDSAVYGLLELILLTLTLFLIIYLQSWKQKKKGRLVPPIVPFAWPLLGHVPQMATDPHGFLLRCYKKYGKVFTILIGRRKMTYVCDRDLLGEFMAADDGQLSFDKHVQDVFITNCFSDTIDNPIKVVKPFIRHFVSSRMSQFVGIINDDLELYMEKFQQKWEAKGGPVLVEVNDLLEDVCHSALFKSTFSFEMSPEIKEIGSNFLLAINKLIRATYFLPRKAIELLFLPEIGRLRNDYIAMFKPMLRKHLEDSTICTSEIMRMAADFEFKIDGRTTITLEDICEVLFAMRFALMTSPLLLCAHAIKELATRPDLWNQIRSELNPSTTSTETILKNSTLHACVMEAGRVNAHFVVLQKGTHPKSYIGTYDVGNSDFVVIPGGLLLQSELAEVNYSDPSKYNPERFMRGPESDSLKIRSFWLWGGGKHACPGRNISIAITKLFLLHLIHRFDVELTSKSEKNYMTLASLPSQLVYLSLTPLKVHVPKN